MDSKMKSQPPDLTAANAAKIAEVFTGLLIQIKSEGKKDD